MIMKKNINMKISNAEVYKEDDVYMVTETTKDDTKTYNINDVLDGLAGASNDSITITTSEEVVPE